ncbi:ninjurin-2-like [Mercenaria mercenaria]|uniref:ninjurin-2-like n=1 Tax=Mercenaria mercenaria TaxID=6596 RepID=UPI001E1E12C7|nr:ninjurin-2-like [Mercenaria mercenaria]
MENKKIEDMNSNSNKDVDFNTYATKKTIAKGLFDFGLLMSNASQLKALLNQGPSQKFYYAVLALISVSLLLQVIVGIMLLVLGRMVWRSDEEKRRANVLNNVTVGFVCAITIVNVFIAAFGIQMSGDSK